MNRSNPNNIALLPLSHKERHARNRNKSGYHIYQSWFYHDWKMCTPAKKLVLIESYNIHPPKKQPKNEDVDDDDSIVSDEPVSAVDATRLCGPYW